jgi:hypothetical protein
MLSQEEQIKLLVEGMQTESIDFYEYLFIKASVCKSRI